MQKKQAKSKKVTKVRRKIEGTSEKEKLVRKKIVKKKTVKKPAKRRSTKKKTATHTPAQKKARPRKKAAASSALSRAATRPVRPTSYGGGSDSPVSSGSHVPEPQFAVSYAKGDGKILVRKDHKKADLSPVAPSKIQEGIHKARSELKGVVEALNDLSDGLAVTGIELEVSFSADGKFLGVGVGGATTIKVAFAPSE